MIPKAALIQTHISGLNLDSREGIWTHTVPNVSRLNYKVDNFLLYYQSKFMKSEQIPLFAH